MPARITQRPAPATTAPQADAPTTGAGNSRRAADATDQSVDGHAALEAATQEAPTEEELNAQIAEARSQGASRGSQTATAVDAGAAAQAVEGAEAVEATEGVEAQGQGGGEAQAVPGAGDAAADVPPPDPTTPPLFQQVGGTIDWDAQVAEHDSFAVEATGQAPAAPAEVDRGALVLQSLGSGAASGLAQGATSVLMDTAINAASTKIPYLSGFVEIGRGAYAALNGEGGAWASQMGSNLIGGGNFGQAAAHWEQGGLINRLEAVVDVGAGVKSIIDTLSSICWIVAALGFVLSFIPGMQWLIPFVALAAKWGSLMGLIGTGAGAVLSILRALLMAGRSMEILFADASPDELQAQAESLRAQTQGFTQALTERAGQTARTHVGQRVAQRRSGDRTPSPAPRLTPSQTPTRLQRARALVGNVAFGTHTIDRSARGAMRREVATTARATATTTRDAVAGRNTTGDRIHALESQGIAVYHSEANRTRTQERLARAGAADPSSAQGRRGQAQAQLEAAEQAAIAAREVRDGTAQRRGQAAEDAQQQADRLARANALPLAERARLADADLNAKSFLLRAATDDLAALRSERNAAASAHRAAQAAVRQQLVDPAVLARTQGAVERADRALVRGQTEQAELTTAVERSQGYVNALRHEGSQRLARDQVHGETLAARMGQSNRFDAIARHDRFADLTGAGADGGHLYGQNQGSGVTGFLTSFIMGDLGLGQAIDQEAHHAFGTQAHSVAKAPQAVISPPPDVARTPAPAGPVPIPYPNQGGPVAPDLDALLQDIWGTLAPPPAQAPAAIDGAGLAHDDLVNEEARLQAQLGTIADHKAAGAETQGELAGAKAMAASGQDAAATLQADADTRKAAQASLASEGARAGAQASTATGETSKAGGWMQEFLGPFLGLMGRIPARFVSNAGGGTSGAQQLQGAAQGQADVSTQAATAALEAQGQATQWQAVTDATKAQTAETDASLLGADATVVGLEQQTATGLAELQSTEGQIRGHLDLIAAEKARLLAEQSSQQAVADAWTTRHSAALEQGLAQVDDLTTPQGEPG